MHTKPAAITSLLIGATVWGLIWYPYRLLQHEGFSGALAVTSSYLICLVLGAVLLRRAIPGLGDIYRRGQIGMLLLVGITSGGCNLGYVLATMHGEVMRVLLLFYLAPLWTVLLSRLLLGEQLRSAGAAVIAMSLAGATTMLWRPDLGLPWPENGAEWLGVAAGFLFALSNVLIRKTSELSIEIKCLSVFAGVVLAGLMAAPFELSAINPMTMSAKPWVILVFIGITLLFTNLVVQYGLTHTPANQAIVVFLFELVVAAVSSSLLAMETMSAKEWVGGALIVAATIFSGRLEVDSDNRGQI